MVMIPEMMNMPTFEQYTMHKQDNKVFALVRFVALDLVYGTASVVLFCIEPGKVLLCRSPCVRG